MNNEERLVKKLTEIYTEAFKELYEKITKKVRLGKASVYERSLLRQVREQLKKLKTNSDEAVRELVKGSYKKGLDELLKDIKAEGSRRSYDMFSGLNVGQINLIADNLTRDLNKAVNLIGRRYEDMIRQITLEETAKKLSQGKTIREMQRRLADELRNHSLNYVEYADGKRHSVKSYADMAARSTTAEAQNTAKIVQGKAWGYDLVRMTSHYPTCEVCAQFQGRVYALTKEAANGKYKDKDGKPLRFPYLYDTALSEGYNTIHPNCRHRLSIFSPHAYTTEQLAEFSRKSMRPFEDVRSDAERRQYAEEQAAKRKRNESYRQWRSIKECLPEDAPKTFAGWQRMKRSRSQRYLDLLDDYKYILKNSNKP